MDRIEINLIVTINGSLRDLISIFLIKSLKLISLHKIALTL